jgi:hypothetical protein
MKISVKSIDSIEIEDSLDCYYPVDASNFGTWIRVAIGPADRPGADDFQILVCTPAWLSSFVEGEAYRAAWGRHMLIVSEYDIGTIKACIERRVDQCSGDDWQSIALKISRFAAWEFEDYQM